MSNQDGNGGDGKDGGDSILGSNEHYFKLPSGRIRVKAMRQGSRIFLEVIAIDGTIDLVPVSPKTVLISTRSLNIKPPVPVPYPRVRRSKAPLLPGRNKPDGG
jgi:hypothetical protein